MKNKKILFAAVLLSVQLVVVQEIYAKDEHRSHGTHVHGVGQLRVAIDSHTLSIELESPAANIVGFEHHPVSADEKAGVEKAKSILFWDGSRLFGLPAAAHCQIADTQLDFELM